MYRTLNFAVGAFSRIDPVLLTVVWISAVNSGSNFGNKCSREATGCLLVAGLPNLTTDAVIKATNYSITSANDQLDAQILNTFITILYMYMFRAISCSSSGGQIVLTL
jgi:hypothetical protein